MIGLTDYITPARWEDIFLVWYVVVDDAYQALVQQVGRLRSRGLEPTFSDSEVITVGLMCDTFFHGHEALCLSFIRQYHQSLFPKLLDDARFNRRRHVLVGVMETVRRLVSVPLVAPEDDVRLIDSAPLPLCTYMRSSQCHSVQGADLL